MKTRRESDEYKEQRMELDIALLEKQIAEAKRKGMSEFDGDRLLLKRKPRLAASDAAPKGGEG